MKITPEQLAAMLPAHSLFSGGRPQELTDLLEASLVQKVRAGETILEQGDEGDSLVLLLEGVVRVGMVTSNGREIILDYAEPGAILGEVAVLDGEPRTASATAMWSGLILRIRAKAFETYLEKHPRFAVRLLRDMASRLRETDQTIETDRAFATGPRLARYLRRLTENKAHGHRLAGDLSQSELGHFVGISRENINRQLSVWAGAGVIELSQGRIRILDGDYLARIAQVEGDHAR